jgi:hypothetical protein
MDDDKEGNLAARLTAIEDRLEIINLLAGAAMSADVAAGEYWTSMFSEDAVLDRKPGAPDVGRDAIVSIVTGDEQHTAAAHGMAHLASVPHITIAGDSAQATGYLLVVIPNESAPAVALPGKVSPLRLSIYHLSVNQWDFLRTPAGWKVTRRIVRPVAGEDARDIINRGILRGIGADALTTA